MQQAYSIFYVLSQKNLPACRLRQGGCVFQHDPSEFIALGLHIKPVRGISVNDQWGSAFVYLKDHGKARSGSWNGHSIRSAAAPRGGGGLNTTVPILVSCCCFTPPLLAHEYKAIENIKIIISIDFFIKIIFFYLC